jgi:DNA-binding transcriptional MerR regulator
LKINELAKLYDITAHTLRYYEKLGLIVPDYDENGYRNYSYRHIEQLNTIRDLRYFDVSIAEIAKYLHQKNVGKTKELLDFEIQALHQCIDDSKKKIVQLEERVQLIEEAEQIDYKKPLLMKHPERMILKSSMITQEEEIDFSLKELHKKYESLLSANNQNLFGSVIHLEKKPYEYQVFYFYPDLSLKNEDVEILPAGTYLSYSFKGDYEQTNDGIEAILQFAKENKLTTVSPFYESYLIDFHETNKPEEYVTRLEILIK